MPIQSWGKNGALAYFGHIFWDMDFKFVLPIIVSLISRVKLSWKSIGAEFTTLPSKNHKNVHILKSHVAQLSITKKRTSPTFIDESVWKFQNLCRSGFRKYQSRWIFD